MSAAPGARGVPSPGAGLKGNLGTALTVRRIACAWCGATIRGDEAATDDETSHGICGPCAATMEETLGEFAPGVLAEIDGNLPGEDAIAVRAGVRTDHPVSAGCQPHHPTFPSFPGPDGPGP